MIRTALLLAALAAALGGCASANFAADVKALSDAGCGGAVTVKDTLTTASLGAPAFTHEHTFNGSCGPVNAATMKAFATPTVTTAP